MMKIFHMKRKIGRKLCTGSNVLLDNCKSFFDECSFVKTIILTIIFSLDAFESEYNPIQQVDCGEREWFGDYIIPIFQGALKLNRSSRVPW